MKNREKAKNGSRARLISLITVALFLVIAAVSEFFSDKAEINYNLADYLGSDIETVMMKGIVISAVMSLTLLPALVLIFDKPMKNTKKKAFVPVLSKKKNR